MAKDNIPRAFISYSWDSDGHKDWVRELGERLETNGVEVRLDQWHLSPGQSITQFMETEIVQSEYVIVICTPNYCTRSISRRGGVGYEQQIISGNLVSGVAREKFIPIVREGEFEPGPKCAIPPHFAGVFALDMRTAATAEASMEPLLRAIYKRPFYEAPRRGSPPPWLSDRPVDKSEEEFEEVRLATMDLDGWELKSGLAQHHRTPDTFYMPEERDRQSLESGDVVKLVFEIAIPPDSEDAETGESFGERMWVLVEGKVGPYYVGVLNNIPATSGEQENLDVGDRVVFLPEHVIDIAPRESDPAQSW